VRSFVFLLFALATLAVTPRAHAAGCQGAFPNPITDICWSCLFPFSIGSVALVTLAQDEMYSNFGSPICVCPGYPPKIGVAIGFWEPARMVDVTRTPFCLAGLGGIEIGGGMTRPKGDVGRAENTLRNSFYQAHWYVNPILHWLEAILEFPCLEKAPLDIAYLTEVDPLWNDDELSSILSPEAILFANPVSTAVCGADCVAATISMPLAPLFWCAGCQGSLYPFTGHVAQHQGGVMASTLIAERLAAKMHRMFVTRATYGPAAMCDPHSWPEPIMNRQQYKFEMVYPIPQTAKIAGQCCQPIGRTNVLWGAGREFPYKGEDFVYQIFRKNNCCVTFY